MDSNRPDSFVQRDAWRTFEDARVGARIEGFGRTISDAEITMVTALTTGFHQPLHTNAHWVRANTGFSNVILPGPVIVAYAIGHQTRPLLDSRRRVDDLRPVDFIHRKPDRPVVDDRRCP